MNNITRYFMVDYKIDKAFYHNAFILLDGTAQEKSGAEVVNIAKQMAFNKGATEIYSVYEIFSDELLLPLELEENTTEIMGKCKGFCLLYASPEAQVDWAKQILSTAAGQTQCQHSTTKE